MQWPPSPGPGKERHEAERLGRRRLDHFPDVDAHAAAHHGDLVDQADVDHAERVLEQLDHLGHLGRADRHHSFERLRGKTALRLQCRRASIRRQPSEYSPSGIWDCPGRPARAKSRGRSRARLSNPPVSSIGSTSSSVVPGIGGRFQDHEHSLVKIFGDLLAGRDDVAHVRIFGFPERSGDADIYSIKFEKSPQNLWWH